MKKIAVLFGAALLTFAMSASAQREKVSGNGVMKKESRSVSGTFENIGASGNFNVQVKQGSATSIEIEGDENLLQYIEVKLKGDDLEIRYRRDTELRPSKPVNVWITNPQIAELAGSGKVRFKSDGKLKGGKLEVALSGTGEADLDLDYSSLEVALSGNGKVKLSGKTEKTEVAISGSADVDAPSMATEVAEVAISGQGNAYMNVSKKLEIAISGSGNVRYKGNATVEQSVSGKGRVTHEN
ncbi:head GIN domain-containing protein [Chitinophaga deserti]|uniref:head GIN domain-containing protein n=1 Tax=Chitinophaga deserti TaxID=2164099 RepID=UPI000D6B43C9|nr:head GIN domain-containing protein [Chitinophaga deserti]